jgi:hypothetical protein
LFCFFFFWICFRKSSSRIPWVAHFSYCTETDKETDFRSLYMIFLFFLHDQDSIPIYMYIYL